MAPRDLRAISDQDAELYHRVRPRYPTRLMDDLAELADRRQSLLACIAELIDQKYGSTVVKRYLYELRIARKRPFR